MAKSLIILIGSASVANLFWSSMDIAGELPLEFPVESGSPR